MLIKNNKKREEALKNEAGGNEKHVFFFTWPLIVATTYDQDNKLNPKKKNWIIFQTETGAVYICYLPAGRSVSGKTVPEVLSKYGPRPQASGRTQDRVLS